MRVFGILLLVCAAWLGWLSYGDRRSALALTVVEWDGRLGLPVAALVGALGLVLVSIPRRRAVASRPAPRAEPTPRAEPAAPPEGWLAALEGQARRLPLEAGARVVLDPARMPPVQLQLERLTPERARRSVELFAELLAAMPLPPRALIRFEGCMVAGPPRHHQVVAALRRYFAADAFSAVQHEDTVEIVFRSPDARWVEAARGAGLRRS